MIKFEFKKLLFKQYGLILIAVLIIAKIFSSSELFKPDYGSLSPQQREVYINYISELGGVLTEEKEAVILEKYTQLSEAENMLTEIERKHRGGEYADMNEYYKALSNVPEIISDRAAIEKLYRGYESVAGDRENRVLLASDAPAMRAGQEYLFLIFICYISAASIYCERKINNLQKTSVKGKKGYAAKLLALLSVTGFVWLVFALIEFSALTAVVSTDNLSASLASLESFKETPYFNITILQGFWAIQGVRLLGYLFTSAVTLILIRFSGNLVLSVFSPAALNIVWIYLFGNKTAAFYQPFSLMRGAPYFTGTHYIDLGKGSGYPEYDEIPASVLAVLITVCAAVIALAAVTVILSGKNRLKGRKHKSAAIAVLTVSALLLGGCSGTSSDKTGHSFGSAGHIAQKGGEYYALRYVTDSAHRVLSTKIAVLDDGLNVKKGNILRNIFETGFLVDGIFEDNGYLYYSAVLEDGSHINRISLDDFSDETVYLGDYAIFMGQTKYFDMITVWADGLNRKDFTVKNFFADGGKVVFLTESEKVYSLDIATGLKTYLFEDAEINDFFTMEGKIYYINMNGELMCFDGSEKKAVTSRIFGSACTDGKYVYGCGTSGVYRYDDEFNETQLSKTKGKYQIRAYDGRVVFETENSWAYISESGEENIDGVDNVFVCDKGLIAEINNELSFYERSE